MAKTFTPSLDVRTFSSSLPTLLPRYSQGRSSWLATRPDKTEGPKRKIVFGSQSSLKSFRILCYGDSNTCGFRTGKGLLPYAQQLADALQDIGLSGEVTSCGLCGFTSEGMVNSMQMPSIETIVGHGEGLVHMLQEGGFDLVVLMVGTNDLGKRMDPEMSKTLVTRLHRACHTLGIPTVSIVPPSVSPFSKHPLSIEIRGARKRLAEMINKWADNCPEVLLSLDCEMLVPKTTAQFWEPDAIHLSAMGSAQLGKELAVQLTKLLGQDQVRQQKALPKTTHQSPPQQFRPLVHDISKSLDGLPSKQKRKLSSPTHRTTGVNSTCGRTAIIGMPLGGWAPAVVPQAICIS